MQNVIGIYNRGVYPIAAGGSYLLDTYTGSTVAYSLRKLSSSTTNVVRVRRSSDNAESDFSATDITDGTLTTWTGANDGFVTKWYDQSGNGNDVLMTIAAYQPKLVSTGVVEVSAFNGKSAMLCDGSNDYFSITTPFAVTQLFYTYFVFDRATTGIYSSAMSGGGTRPYPFLWYAPNDNIYTDFGITKIVSPNNTSTGDFMVSTLRDSSNNVKTWLNGSALTTNVDSGTTGSMNILLARGGGLHNGYVQEVVYWNSDQESNRTGIETDTNTYYSVY